MTSYAETVAGRNREMLDRYVAGETLQSVADRFGMTREGVRQIIQKQAPGTNGIRLRADENMRRRKERVERLFPEYRRRYLLGEDLIELKRDLGLTVIEQRMCTILLTPAERAARRHATEAETERASLARLRYQRSLKELASLGNGSYVTHLAWNEHAAPLGLLNHQMMLIKSGMRWVELNESLGNVGGHTAGPEQRYSDQDCIDAIRLCAAETGGYPSYEAYGEWHKRRMPRGTPTNVTIRNRYQGSWWTAIRAAGIT